MVIIAVCYAIVNGDGAYRCVHADSPNVGTPDAKIGKARQKNYILHNLKHIQILESS